MNPQELLHPIKDASNTKASNLRHYRSEEEVHVGDVIQVFDHAYGTGILVRRRGKTWDMERAVMKMDDGVPCMYVERMEISEEILRKNYLVYTMESGTRDNRDY